MENWAGSIKEAQASPSDYHLGHEGEIYLPTILHGQRNPINWNSGSSI